MVTSCYPSYSLKQCSALLLIHEPNTYAFNIDYPNKNTNQAVWVVGSCNGLVCIAISKKEWYLWNPSTKISKKLPSLDFIVKPTFHTFHNIYGFGYCESNDDYKVVGILSALGNAGVYESVVKVYSLRTNSWKRIEDFNFGVPLDNSGKFVAGKIHFAMIMGIVSLDLESEVYGKIEQPNYEEGTILEPSLGVLGGCISVLCNYNTRADVWVMKEYGVKESWTKVVSVPYFNDPETKKLFYSRPLCLLSTRELLLVIDSQFVVYDKKDNCLRLSNFGRFLEADIYVESLISPIPEN